VVAASGDGQTVQPLRLIDGTAERGSRPPDLAPLTLGADEFFVLGDNRGNSNDSRFRGPVARHHIYGRVEFIYFSTAGGGVTWERFPVTLHADGS
jgi:signal peptidase I